MACSGVIRLGDEQTSLEFLVLDCQPDGTSPILDITTATDLTIRFKRQNGIELDKAGVLYTDGVNGDGTDGIVQYVTEPGFITSVDIGTLQGIAIVTFPNGSIYHSSPGKFKVKNNF